MMTPNVPCLPKGQNRRNYCQTHQQKTTHIRQCYFEEWGNGDLVFFHFCFNEMEPFFYEVGRCSCYHKRQEAYKHLNKYSFEC